MLSIELVNSSNDLVEQFEALLDYVL